MNRNKIDLKGKSPSERLYVEIFQEVPDADVEATDVQDLFEILKNALKPREFEVIVRFFGLSSVQPICQADATLGFGFKPETLAQIAKDLGISAENTRRTKERVLFLLRRPLWAKPLRDLYKSRETLRSEIAELHKKMEFMEQKEDLLFERLRQANENSKELAESLSRRTNNGFGAPERWPIEHVALSAGAHHALKMGRLNVLGDITALSEEELRKVRHIGPRRLEEIKKMLCDLDLSLRKKE